MNPKIWHYQGFAFEAEIYPKKAGKAQEVKIVPVVPQTGERVTKRQMEGKDSDQSYKVKLKGKDVAEIRRKAFPEAAKKIIEQLRQVGILPMPYTPDDFQELAEEYGTDFLQSKKDTIPWQEKTYENYTSIFNNRVKPLLRGLKPSEMTIDDYKRLQINICKDASDTASNDKYKNWKSGEELPPTGKKGVYLLYLFLWYLLCAGLCSLSFLPFLYGGKISQIEKLHMRASRVQSFPNDITKELLKLFEDDFQARLLLDCGLRLNECTGLIWCNLHVLDSSQGKVYILQVTGQLNKDGYYVEYGKTNNAYRYIAVSQELGEKLVAKRMEIERKIGHKLSLEPICGYESNGKYISTPQFRKKYARELEDKIKQFFRTGEKQERFYQELKYMLPKQKENEKLNQKTFMRDSLTTHACRRNYCTNLYCSSGLPMEEIYQSMGHDPSHLTNQLPRGGKPEGDQCMLGLQKLVSQTAFHHQQPLRYDADGPYPRTEVPACDTILTVKKGQVVEVCVYPTEPNTKVKMDTPAGTIQQENFVEMLQYQFTTALLAAEDDHTIVKTSFPFREEEEKQKK